MKKNIVFALIFALLQNILPVRGIFAQEKTSPQSQVIAGIPRMEIKGKRNPISLRDLKIDVEMIGNLALTTYEMTFYNPNNNTMEGEFILPLGENQAVCALALDMGGKMREGVVVEKEKARQTFETVVRQGVDPALVEKTAGNQFKTRIYPFDPEGTRTIRPYPDCGPSRRSGNWNLTPGKTKKPLSPWESNIPL